MSNLLLSLTQFSFDAPTTPPLYTLLSASGVTPGLDAARPGLLATVGRILERVLSLTTTATTSGFKWLSLGNFSRRRFGSHPTPTSAYYLEPTATFLATGNCSLAIIAIPPLICFFSLLFGAAVVLSRRGESSSSLCTVYRQKQAKNENLSMYSESPTLFHQDTVSPPKSYVPRLSSFWISALGFGFRGLGFLFRFICIEKLLDMVEDNSSTEQTAATIADSPIAELRALNKKLGHTIATPTQALASLARFPDTNKTLVAPFSVHAKSNPGLGVVPISEHNTVDVIPLSEYVKALLTYPASTRKVPVTPPAPDVLGLIVDPLGPVASSVPSSAGGESSLPILYRRSSLQTHRRTSSPDTVLAPFSVEPDIPSPVYKSSYMPFRPTGDRPSTPRCHNEAVSPSVEPSGAPDEFVAALGPHAQSSAQAEMRPARCLEDSPQRPRYSKSSTLALDVASKPHPASVYQTAVHQMFKRCYDDMSNNSKPTARTSSVLPLDPTLEMGTRHRTGVLIKEEECPKAPPRKDVKASPEDFRIRRDESTLAIEAVRLASSTEEIPPRLLNNTSRKDRSGSDALELTRDILLSGRSSAVAEANRSRFESVEEMRENARKVIERARGAAAAFDQRMRSKYPLQFSAAGTESRPKSVETIQENARRTIKRSQEAAAAIDMRIRTKYPGRESQPGEQPRRPKRKSTGTDPQAVGEEKPRANLDAMQQIRREHDDLLARVHATLKHHDAKRELRAQSMSSRSQAVDNTKNSPGFKRPSTLLSKQVPTTTQSGPSRELPHLSKYLTLIKPRESEEVATVTETSPRKLPRSTLPSKLRPLTPDSIARIDSRVELGVPVSDRSCAEGQGEGPSGIEQTGWSPEGYVPLPPLEEFIGISTAEDRTDESSCRIEDYIPEATDNET